MVGEGDEDHTYWGPPELYPKSISRPGDFATEETPGSDVCAQTSAALAISYMNFKDTEPEYAEKCLKVAKAMYEFSKKYRGMAKGDGYYNSICDEDELSWAAAWLYDCTKDMRYIDEINSATSDGLYTGYMKKIVRDNNNNTWQNIWVHSWDAVWGGAFMKLNSLFPENERFEYFARWNVEYLSGGKILHKDPNDKTYIATSPRGYTMINGWGSARYNTAAQLCALTYEKYHPTRTDFGDWAKSQMEYIMGRNPMGYSYIVGYGKEKGLPSVQHPHHRAAHGSKTLSMNDPVTHRHTLWGALAGGPDLNDYHKDETTDYVYNEVAVDYNAAFVGACAGLFKYYGKGQKPIANFPPKEDKFDPYYCEVKLEQENKERTQVTLKIHNESSQPPHFEKGMMVRYFFNISELIESGQSIEDVRYELAYDEQISLQEEPIEVRGPFKWDEAGTYYYEFDWTGKDVYGDREYQFALIEKQDPNYQNYWDPTNDWSRKNVVDSFNVSKNVPVYLDGVKVFGEEPPKLVPTPTPTIDVNATPVNNAQIKVKYKCSEIKEKANTIRAAIKIENTGKTSINLADIKVRYWYTDNNAQGQSFVCEWAQIGEENVSATFNKIENAVDGADSYCEIGFAKDAGVLAAGATTNAIPFRIEQVSSYDQSDDYSFDSDIADDFAENQNISGYVKGILKFGDEPVKVGPTPSKGHKISGYVKPEFNLTGDIPEKYNAGFKVEIEGTDVSAVTDKDGYFEMVVEDTIESGSTIRISKPSYLARVITIKTFDEDLEISSESKPVTMWAGDIRKNGKQDEAINMADIIEMSLAFNTVKTDARYKEELDIDMDGAIILKDIMIMARYFSRITNDYPEI